MEDFFSFYSNSNEPSFFVFPALQDSQKLDSHLIATHLLNDESSCSYLAFTFSEQQFKFYCLTLQKVNTADHFSKGSELKIQDIIMDESISEKLSNALNKQEVPKQLQLIQRSNEEICNRNISPFFKGISSSNFLAAAKFDNFVVLISLQLNNFVINGSKFEIKSLEIQKLNFDGNILQLFIHPSLNKVIASINFSNSIEIISRFYKFDTRQNNIENSEHNEDLLPKKIGQYEKKSEFILPQGVGVSKDFTVVRTIVRNDSNCTNRFYLETFQIQHNKITKTRKPLTSLLSESCNINNNGCSVFFSSTSSYLTICDGNNIEVHDLNNHSIKNIVKESSHSSSKSNSNSLHFYPKFSCCLDKSTLLVGNSSLNSGIALYNLDNPISVLEAIPIPNRILPSPILKGPHDLSSPNSIPTTPNSLTRSIPRNSASEFYVSPCHILQQAGSNQIPSSFGQIKQVKISKQMNSQSSPTSATDLMEIYESLQKEENCNNSLILVLAFLSDLRVLPIIIDKEQLDLKLPELKHISSQLTSCNRGNCNNDDSLNFLSDLEASNQKSNKSPYDLFKTPDRKGSFNLGISSLDSQKSNWLSKSIMRSSSHNQQRNPLRGDRIHFGQLANKDHSLNFEMDGNQNQYRLPLNNRLLFMETSNSFQFEDINRNKRGFSSFRNKKLGQVMKGTYHQNSEDEIIMYKPKVKECNNNNKIIEVEVEDSPKIDKKSNRPEQNINLGIEEMQDENRNRINQVTELTKLVNLNKQMLTNLQHPSRSRRADEEEDIMEVHFQQKFPNTVHEDEDIENPFEVEISIKSSREEDDIEEEEEDDNDEDDDDDISNINSQEFSFNQYELEQKLKGQSANISQKISKAIKRVAQTHQKKDLPKKKQLKSPKVPLKSGQFTDASKSNNIFLQDSLFLNNTLPFEVKSQPLLIQKQLSSYIKQLPQSSSNTSENKLPLTHSTTCSSSLQQNKPPPKKMTQQLIDSCIILTSHSSTPNEESDSNAHLPDLTSDPLHDINKKEVSSNLPVINQKNQAKVKGIGNTGSKNQNCLFQTTLTQTKLFSNNQSKLSIQLPSKQQSEQQHVDKQNNCLLQKRKLSSSQSSLNVIEGHPRKIVQTS